MNFFDAVRSGYKNYANFKGRARRAEYWYFTLFVTVLGVVCDQSTRGHPFDSAGGMLLWIAALATVLPNLAVTARRLHDVDRSGWWMLIAGIPVIGGIVLLIWLTTRGDDGHNCFGEDPLHGV